MNKISIHNYEAFMLDYAEGCLNPDEIADLILFLSQHPELKQDLPQSPLPTLSADATCHPEKISLEKSETDLRIRFEDLSMRFYENNLNSVEQREFELILSSNPMLNHEHSAFAHCFLKPDLSVGFMHLDTLKKQLHPVGSFDHLAVSKIEGLLNKQDTEKFLDELSQDKSLKKTWRIFQHTRLQPESFVFPQKKSLYRTKKGSFQLYYYAAAILVLALILPFMFQKKNPGPALVRIEPYRIEKQEIPVQPEAWYGKPIPNDTVRVKSIQILESEPQKTARLLLPEKLVSHSPILTDKTTGQTIKNDLIVIQPQDNMRLTTDPLATNDTFLSPVEWLARNRRFTMPDGLATIADASAFADASLSGIEKISKGYVAIDRKKINNKIQIQSISIGNFSYSRSHSSN
jgi:hypothetical protein